MTRKVRPCACRRPHQLDHAADLGLVEPGHHLVEQDELRLERERARDLQAAPLAQRQLAGADVGAVRQADLSQHRVARGRAASCSGAVVQEGADHHVLERGQRDQRLGDLEGAADAALRALVRRQRVDAPRR